LALRAYRVDGNQKAIVAALREEGFIVQHLHKVGEGCPDLLVGHSHNGKRYNVLLELKDGDGKLTAQQVKDDMDVYLNKDTVESLATVFKVN
jgi:hypothetical protein